MGIFLQILGALTLVEAAGIALGKYDPGRFAHTFNYITLGLCLIGLGVQF